MCLSPKSSSKSLTWILIGLAWVPGFFSPPVWHLGLVIAVSSRHHTDCKLGKGRPNGKSRCHSPKQEEQMLEKTSSGLLYHPSWSSSPKVLPTSKTLDDLSFAPIVDLEVLKGIFNATPKSLWKNTLQGKSTARHSCFGRPQLGLGMALHAGGRF